MAMQAVRINSSLVHYTNLVSKVGRALEIWVDGEKSTKKPPAFSADNYGDTYVKVDNGGKSKRRKIRRASLFVPTLQSFNTNTWKGILREAREYLPESRKRRISSASSTTLAPDTSAEDFEDPDADFIMVL